MRVDAIRERRGLSLPELLVVLTIIAILGSVAAPALYRMGVFSRDKVDYCARELFSLYRAAKVYAATYRTKCAFGYGAVPAVHDTVLSMDRWCADSVFMLRELTAQEKMALGKTASETWFVPLEDRNGNFQGLEPGTCVYMDIPIAMMVNQDWALVEAQLAADYGIQFVNACRLDGTHLLEWPPGTPVWRFPAHVFRPSGTIHSASPKQRFVLRVALTPDATPSKRFVNPDFPVYHEEVKADLELFASTGRMKVSD